MGEQQWSSWISGDQITVHQVMDPFLSIHLDYILPANAVMDSGAHTNAIAKYVVLEAHT